MNKGYVYSGEIDANALRQLIQSFSDLTVLSWDLSQLDFPSGVELRRAGCAFNPELEIRWESTFEGRFLVLVLSDTELNLPGGFEPVKGDWWYDKIAVRLVDLTDKRFAPQFSAYPGGGNVGVKLKCSVFRRGVVVTFVSPREVSHAEES